MIVKEVDLTGKEFSNYKIIGKLGAGGMATVYKAHELSLNRMVALKVLSPRLSEDSDFIKRFHREAQSAAQLNHPNIVHIFAIGEEEGFHYFAMEYLKGKTLSNIKKEEGVLPSGRSIAIIKQVAAALGEAHKAGLVHRDVKPCNIMIDDSGIAKVTDFGIAFVTDAKTKLTQDGSIIGTPEYLSPEQCEGKTVDGRSDIYSLGVTMYEILTGKTPYEADTPVSMLMKIVKGNFPPIGQVNPAVPEPVQKIVEKMMQTDPQNRYANADELMIELQEVEKVLTMPEVPAATGTGAAIKQPEPAAVTHSIEPHFQEKKKNSSVWSAVTVAAIIVLLMGGAFAAKVLYFDKKAGAAKPSPAVESISTAAVNPSETPGAELTTQPGQSIPAEQTPSTSTDTTPSSASASTSTSTSPSSYTSPTSTSTTPSTSTPTSTFTSPTSTQPALSVKKAGPASNSLVVSVLGDADRADMITAYVQAAFSRANFAVVDGPSMGNESLGGIARYHLVVTIKQMETTTLQYYGSTSEQYSLGLTMKAVETQGGKIAAGPFTRTVKYTSLNAADNLKAAVAGLAAQLQKALGK
ncbi:MAG: protein kinase [Candidatus Aminicenantes bacterium]|nr:protein kinase [Candidatus Aminicenantes bacterium]